MNRKLTRGLLVLTLVFVTASLANALTLVQDGKPVATIVIRDSALQVEAYKPARGVPGTLDSKIKLAAVDLQTYIEKMSGAKLPIVSDVQDVKGTVVLVGRSKRTDALTSVKIPAGLTAERTEEGYVVYAKGDTLVLAGNDEGPYICTYYAVAEFLRRQGVRWIMPSDMGEIVPKKATISCDNVNATEKPAFRYRTWWCNQPADLGAVEAIWKLRNKMQLADDQLIGIPGDSYLRNYMPDLVLTNSKPELFAKNLDGTVNPYMPNLMNPDAAKAVADKVIAAIQKSEAAGKRIHSLGFAPDDGLPQDLTPKTMNEWNQGFTDWVGREGVATELSVSEEWFQFINRVAEYVCKVYPDFILTTNGYANRSLPPEGVKLHPNLGVMTAFIWADNTKPVTSPRSWQGQVMGAQLKRWCELCKRVFIYEYNATMLVTALTPVPQMRKTAANYSFFKKCGMNGFFNETTFAYMQDGICNRYVRANLMWEPDINLQAFLDDYYKVWYGPAAKPAAAFWTAIEDALLDSNLLGHEDRFLPWVYSQGLIAALEKSCSEAEKLADTDVLKTRVRIDRLTLEHLKDYMAYKDAEFDGKWTDAVKRLNHMLELRAELNKISPILVMPASTTGIERYFVGDHYWGTIQRRDYFQKLGDMTNGKDGDLVALAPKQAKFTLDEGGLGKDLRWYAPDFDRSKWRDLDSTKPFYLQGYLSENGTPWVGRMWYVFEVNVPSSFKGKTVRLYTPFVTCQAWAWVNGEYAGSRKYMEAYWSPAPFDFDVTNLVKPGKNTIGIWVSTGVNRTQASEGILGRVMLYSPKDPNKTMTSN